MKLPDFRWPSLNTRPSTTRWLPARRSRDAPLRKTWPGDCARSVIGLVDVPLALKRMSTLLQEPDARVMVSPGTAWLIAVASSSGLLAGMSAAQPGPAKASSRSEEH